jgi:membrane-bound serine protease (ClpP class)
MRWACSRTFSRFRRHCSECRVGFWSALLVLLMVLKVSSGASEIPRAVVLEIDGVIGPAIANYIVREFHRIRASDTRLVILRINTPGGLDTSMREIIGTILSSPVPVAAYVAPSGARAASAGTFIVYACAVAAMAPGTNLGAATPIQLGGLPGFPEHAPERPTGRTNLEKAHEASSENKSAPEPADAEMRKVINDAIAFIRGLAELNGRNADWAADAVRFGVSVPASEALKLHVIDVIADDLPELLRKLDGTTVKVGGRSELLETAGSQIDTEEPDWRTELLALVTNPNVAFILMLIGLYGLIFEFINPGTVVPGLFGSISLLVALFGLNLFPINYAGTALVLLGIGLMVAEAHIGSFGVIGVGGVIAFVVGSIMMFPSGVPGFTLSRSLIAAVTLVTAGFLLLFLSLLLRSRRRPTMIGKEALLATTGEAIVWQEAEGRVRVNGEIWRARAAGPVQPGTLVKVIGRDGLVLVVEPS